MREYFIALIMVLTIVPTVAFSKTMRHQFKFSPPIPGANYLELQTAAAQYFELNYGLNSNEIKFQPSRFYPRDLLMQPKPAMGVITDKLFCKYYPEHGDTFGGNNGGTTIAREATGSCITRE